MEHNVNLHFYIKSLMTKVDVKLMLAFFASHSEGIPAVNGRKLYGRIVKYIAFIKIGDWRIRDDHFELTRSYPRLDKFGRFILATPPSK
jgi:hypothetical protein